jgi:2-keto-4-pentenoate hydratase/2-oxohepta-3-ene-1,7-dioic acid hydratase in catechol pathway
MGLSVVRFERADRNVRWGILQEGEIAVLGTNYPSHRELMDDYFSRPQQFRDESLERVALADVRLLAPITRDVQIFCQGLNYATHREEGGVSAAKGENLIFSKPPSSICGPYDDIVRPAGCELLDYEIELALVLKRDLPAHAIVSEDTLLDYVGALTLSNDVSARDFMFGAPMLQWFKGKGQRTFCPTGPVLYLIDADETELIDNLHLTLKLNDETRQDATTDQLIFKPAETLTELGAFADVNRGDLLLTGTPGGVILNATPRVGLAILLNFTNDIRRRAKLVKTQNAVRYLQPGDRLELELRSRDGTLDLGKQLNTVIDPPAASTSQQGPRKT